MRSCDEFERWLDQGSPAAGALDARAHAGGCASCAAAERAALELEAALATAHGPAVTPAPPGFTPRVMARIAAFEEARVAAWALDDAALPWWVRAAAQPATALACVLGGLVVWKPEALQSAAAAALAWLQGAISTPRLSLPTLPHPYGDPLVQLGLALAALPFAAWAGWALYRWSERLVCPPGLGLGHRV
ncbi:MAG: hypothetical protein A2V63_02275 [Candidatus Eisenbacteria bacterium RBG_19FT_COMBO_70_11]|nr:MAG: hypothetical protein A2V63_02275 [Candidatus Eisenbacteria bacterium RBG_19FT_COMBO_70_11]